MANDMVMVAEAQYQWGKQRLWSVDHGHSVEWYVHRAWQTNLGNVATVEYLL
jgi:hypothetical protein